MGRNAIPKLFEWRDGTYYSIKQDNKIFTDLSNGKQTIITRKRKQDGEIIEDYLSVFWADGVAESLMSAYTDGHSKGVELGKILAKQEIRHALGVKLSDEEFKNEQKRIREIL